MVVHEVIPRVRTIFEDFNRLSLLDSYFCTRCGACVVSCPYGSISLGERSPHLEGYCQPCGLCYSNCPQFYSEFECASEVFGSFSDSEGIGVYKNTYSARSKLEKIRKGAQDGGLVTTILYSLLNTNYIDAAVVTGEGVDPWKPSPKVVTVPEQVKNFSGTFYSSHPILEGLRSAVVHYLKKRIAVVGVPCQVKSLRLMGMGRRALRSLNNRTKLIIGLFCMESFPYRNILRIVNDEFGLSIQDVSKFDVVKGNFTAYTENGDQKEIPVEDLSDLMNGSCTVCLDFASELADISVGSVGAPNGYNAVITRTERGEEAFQRALESGVIESEPLSDVKPGLKLIEKLSSRKKEKRRGEIERRMIEGKSVPPRCYKNKLG